MAQLGMSPGAPPGKYMNAKPMTTTAARVACQIDMNTNSSKLGPPDRPSCLPMQLSTHREYFDTGNDILLTMSKNRGHIGMPAF
mmetsp:Transcript_28967/g.35209  ORF Transcript_28967/g.35209 Transcript_28967/m.35209 type:complete len:84 (+) Transcript_28967:275-526(+)